MPRKTSSPADLGGNDAPASGRLWVVLPVYNEAAAIERVIVEWLPVLESTGSDFVLLVVDDGSTDETPNILERLARADPRLRIVRQANSGHGPACVLGYRLATSPESDADWVLQIDSDGQCDPADFAKLWAGRLEHPLQLGRRLRREDGSLRAATSRFLALLVSLGAQRTIRDPNVPFRLMRRDVLARALDRFEAPGTERRAELANAALAVVLAEITEPRWVPIGFRRRFAGQSHYRFRRMGALAVELLRWIVVRVPPAADESAIRTHRPLVRVLATLSWCALLGAVALYTGRNLASEGLWYDEVMQVHTSLGIHPMSAPFVPEGTLRDVVARNSADQLDPGGFGVLLHVWMRVFGTGARALHALPGLLVSAGLAALGALAWRWTRSPLAAAAAVALALADPLVREHALEVRPYALELAGVWIAFWAADRLLERPAATRALVFGLAILGLLGSRYSAFLTTAALCGALVLQMLPLGLRGEAGRRVAVLGLALLPPLLGVAAVVRWSLPGLVHRATFEGGRLVDYVSSLTLGSRSPGEAIALALRHLAHPAALGLTLAAVLAVPLVRRSAFARMQPSSRLVRLVAVLLLLLTAGAWPWHPWEPATKWSFYLRLVSMVCLVRLAADLLPWLRARAIGRVAAVAAALALITVGAWRAATHERWRWDVAFPALERVGGGLLAEAEGDATRLVAVDVHPMPGVRYHYEYGSLRGRPEYPRAFLLPVGGTEPSLETLCASRWLLSFDSVASLERRYPGLRFREDSVADQLVSVSNDSVSKEGVDGAMPCDAASAGSIERGPSGRAR